MTEQDKQDIYNKALKELKINVQKEIKEAFLNGAKEGSITTIATLYGVILDLGLDESNLIFTIMRDLAEKNGCKDIHARIALLKAYSEPIKEEK